MKFNKILFLVCSREKNGNIDFNNADREYILQEVIRRYDPNIPVSKLLKYLDRKTRIPLFEVKKLVKSNDVDLSKKLILIRQAKLLLQIKENSTEIYRIIVEKFLSKLFLQHQYLSK